MTDDVRLTDSTARVALDLFKIVGAAVDKGVDNKDRAYYFELFAQCQRAVGSSTSSVDYVLTGKRKER